MARDARNVRGYPMYNAASPQFKLARLFGTPATEFEMHCNQTLR